MGGKFINGFCCEFGNVIGTLKSQPTLSQLLDRYSTLIEKLIIAGEAPKMKNPASRL
jgi:hypothetical protein